MNLESLMRSTRTPTLLVQKPNINAPEYWDIPLSGLHHEQIKASVSEFRAQRQKSGEKLSHPSLKNCDLLDNVAIPLGAKSYKHWRHEVEPALSSTIDQHDRASESANKRVSTHLKSMEYESGLFANYSS